MPPLFLLIGLFSMHPNHHIIPFHESMYHLSKSLYLKENIQQIFTRGTRAKN